MDANALLENFRGYSLSIATHPLTALAEFPDSRTFYSGIGDAGKTTLPAGVRSALYMATCNRIEVYAEFEDGMGDAAAEEALRAISPVFDAMVFKDAHCFQGKAMLEHLIAVASGLKSLALGETQIAGQIKRDMAHAQSAGWLSAGMQTLLKKVLETQKKIRSNTGISENSYSLMTLVDNLIAERGLNPIDDALILIGASEMSAKVARFAMRRGVNKFLLVRKDLARAMNAEMRSLIDSYPQVFSQITQDDFHALRFNFSANAVILASSVSDPLMGADDCERLIAAEVIDTNAAIVDLSLPANAGEDVAERYGRQLISLASLQQLSDAARAERAASAASAAPIIRRAIYQLWLDLLYRENTGVVQSYLNDKSTQSEAEWQRLAAEAALNEKQKRIMYDFIKKEQRRALASHREMILDLIAGSTAERPG